MVTSFPQDRFLVIFVGHHSVASTMNFWLLNEFKESIDCLDFVVCESDALELNYLEIPRVVYSDIVDISLWYLASGICWSLYAYLRYGVNMHHLTAQKLIEYDGMRRKMVILSVR